MAINESSFFAKLFALLVFAAIGFGVISFIYNHYKIKSKEESDKNNVDESKDTQYELLNAIQDGPLITDV